MNSAQTPIKTSQSHRQPVGQTKSTDKKNTGDLPGKHLHIRSNRTLPTWAQNPPQPFFGFDVLINRIQNLNNLNPAESLAHDAYGACKGRFTMRFLRYLALLGILMVPAAYSHAQVSFGIGVGPGYGGYGGYYGAPVCQWGYYGYAPYSCAPYGYYGPSWFNGGLFIGAGPWFRGGYGFRGYGYRAGYRGGYGRGYAGRGFAGGRAVGGGFHGDARGGGGGFHGGGGGGFHGGGGGHGGGGHR
jgi:hypothetical protein